MAVSSYSLQSFFLWPRFLSFRDRPSGPVPLALSGVEVRSYEGKDLLSVNDFHENSIKDPQHVNISDYRLKVTGLTNATCVFTYDEVPYTYPH
jgi:hypothetical protein